MQSDIRVRSVETFKVMTRCRTPLKFGAVVVDELPIGYARVTVENRRGQVATGWGAMFLMDLWAWPVSQAPHAVKNQIMCDLLDAYAGVIGSYNEFSHPLEIFMTTKADLERMSQCLCNRLTPGEMMPYLGALIAASPVDHALHDAFGRVNAIDAYQGYGPAHMDFDLARYLGQQYQGVYPSQFLRQDYAPSVPIFHLVGGLDLLYKHEVTAAFPQDGTPNSLDEWIARDGVFCLKVKLQGRNLARDINRTLEVSRIYHEVRATVRPDLPVRPYLTADTNELFLYCYFLIVYLHKIREQAPQVYDEILYLEQPTERELSAHRWDMRRLAQYKPVLIDESLATVEDFALAVELGWSGIALKSCKCLSSDLLFIPLAEMNRIPYAVQDLTNPSLALIESVGLAARTHTILGVEANSRQFFPAANEIAASVHPELYHVRNGVAKTATLRGSGLGLQIEQMPALVKLIEENG